MTHSNRNFGVVLGIVAALIVLAGLAATLAP
jgi:hypothetical protein